MNLRARVQALESRRPRRWQADPINLARTLALMDATIGGEAALKDVDVLAVYADTPTPVVVQQRLQGAR